MNLQRLRDLGFDQASHKPFTKEYRVKCSCCDALVINGTPTHETGCPNTKHECMGCNAIVDRHIRYCEDCR